MQNLRRSLLGPAPAPFVEVDALPAYAAAQQSTSSVSPHQRDEKDTFVREKAALVQQAQQLQLKEPIASLSVSHHRSPEQLRRRAHERATEVIVSGLKALAQAAQARGQPEVQLLRFARACLAETPPAKTRGYEQTVPQFNSRMIQGQGFLKRAASLKVDVPQWVYNDYAAACWQDLAASLASMLRENQITVESLSWFVCELLAETPPTHQHKTEYVFLRALFMPTMESFVEAGEVEHLDALESVVTAVHNSANKKGKKAVR